jgi:hypothetical protein
MGNFSKLAFTPSVNAVQERMGSRRAYARFEPGPLAPDSLGETESEFLAEQDHFYIASVGSTGWPYVQHRGGAKGFVQVIDEHTLAFADLRGNRQYISLGNIETDERVALIFVDYPTRTRLKILARAKVLGRNEATPLFERIATDPKVEHVVLLQVEAIDWNCQQHITPRFTEEQIAELVRPLRAEVERLEHENARLRGEVEGRPAPPRAGSH